MDSYLEGLFLVTSTAGEVWLPYGGNRFLSTFEMTRKSQTTSEPIKKFEGCNKPHLVTSLGEIWIPQRGIDIFPKADKTYRRHDKERLNVTTDPSDQGQL